MELLFIVSVTVVGIFRENWRQLQPCLWRHNWCYQGDLRTFPAVTAVTETGILIKAVMCFHDNQVFFVLNLTIVESHRCVRRDMENWTKVKLMEQQ